MTVSKVIYGNVPNGAGGQRLPFSPAIRAGDFVFVSGQVGMNERGEIEPGGIEAQTRQSFKNLEGVLALAGCSLMVDCKVEIEVTAYKPH